MIRIPRDMVAAKMQLPVTGRWKPWLHQPSAHVKKHTAAVGCIGCGAAITLPGHAIDENGVVSPSVVCRSCGWHVHLTLEGWTL